MTTIAHTDANIAYSPYTWLVDGTNARTINPGAYLSVAFTGSATGLAALFSNTGVTGPAEVQYRVDGGPWTDANTAASVTLTVPSYSSAWPKHLVEIRCRGRATGGPVVWSSPTGFVQFLGISATGTITSFALQRPEKKALLIGDSLAQGVYTQTTTHNAVLGWAYPLRDLLGLDVGVVGFGGVGITTAGDFSVPAFPTSWDQLWDGQARSFTTPPDLVVTVPGTNDSGASDGTVQTAMTAWLDDMLTTLPNTKIAVVKNWLGTKATPIQAACLSCSDPTRVTWIDTTGWWSSTDAVDAVHPYGYSNLTNLAPRLANELRDVLDPTSGEFIYINSAWVAI